MRLMLKTGTVPVVHVNSSTTTVSPLSSVVFTCMIIYLVSSFPFFYGARAQCVYHDTDERPGQVRKGIGIGRGGELGYTARLIHEEPVGGGWSAGIGSDIDPPDVLRARWANRYGPGVRRVPRVQEVRQTANDCSGDGSVGGCEA